MLKPYYSKELKEKYHDELKGLGIAYRRNSLFFKELSDVLPPDIEIFYSFNPLMSAWLRVFLYPVKGYGKNNWANEKNTKIIIKSLLKLTGKLERFFREDEGKFSYKGEIEREDKDGKYEITVFLENPNPGKCKIIQKRKMKKVWVAECSDGPLTKEVIN